MNDEDDEFEDEEEDIYRLAPADPQPLSILSLTGHAVQCVGNVFSTIGATLQSASQEFFLAGEHQREVRKVYEQTRFTNDARADFERMFPNE